MGQIIRKELPQQSWASGVSAALTPAMKVTGRCEQVNVKVSDNTGNRTATVVIKEKDGSGELFNKSTIAENATTVFQALSNKGTQDADFNPFLADEELQFTITPSGDPGSGGMDVDVALYMVDSGY